jgi:type III pantothenate kinase
LLASFGAYRYLAEQGPVVTVQAGTAITVDLVDRDGTFVGGSIMPGIGLSLFSLGRGTSLLPWLAEGDLQGICPLPGKNTEEAIRVGVQAAAIGGVEHLVKRYRASLGSAMTPVIISGGDGAWIAHHVPPPIHVVDQLVLRALITIFGSADSN